MNKLNTLLEEMDSVSIFNKRDESPVLIQYSRQGTRLLKKKFSLLESHTSMGSRAKLLSEDGEESTTDEYSIDTASIQSEFQKKLGHLGLEGITVGDIDDDGAGSITVEFYDADDDYMQVVFMYDEDDGAQAIIVDDSEGDDDIATTIDLDPLAPSILMVHGYKYINLKELAWLNKTTMSTLLSAGSFDDDVEKAQYTGKDEFGNISVAKVESLYLADNGSIVEASYKTVIRGGKKVRLPIIRRRRKKRLPSSVRAAMSRAARKSARNPATKRARKRSLKIRDRAHLKRGFKKGFKV